MAVSLSRRTPVTSRWILRLTWLVTGRQKFRPIWQADLVANDLLGQAEFLFSAGYQIAAAMLTRSHVERSLKRLALMTNNWKQCRGKSVPDFCEFLRRHGNVDPKLIAVSQHIWTTASRICHTGSVSRGEVFAILNDARSFQKRFNIAMQYALDDRVQVHAAAEVQHA